MAPAATFVVPCYNYGRYLRECVDSILAQDGYPDVEVIIIDDCSPDDTAAVAAGYAGDSRVRVIHHAENKGHLYSVGEGFEAARAPLSARIDADDRLRPNFLSTLLPIFKLHLKVGFAFGDAAIIDGGGSVNVERCPQPFGGRPFNGWALLEILEKNFVCAPTVLARTEAWTKHLPVWDGLAFNDWYFNVMIARNWDYGYVTEVIADYRVHGTNWHTKVTVERTEEPSLMRVLDWVYAHPEADPSHERAKQAVKSRVYAAHYLDLAEKYFGVGFNADARRCYVQAARRRPGLLLRPGPARRYLATVVGRSWYEAAKRLMITDLIRPSAQPR
jgi:glycosyltransferase involved in cell wall biosynthesis